MSSTYKKQVKSLSRCKSLTHLNAESIQAIYHFIWVQERDLKAKSKVGEVTNSTILLPRL